MPKVRRYRDMRLLDINRKIRLLKALETARNFQFILSRMNRRLSPPTERGRNSGIFCCFELLGERIAVEHSDR